MKTQLKAKIAPSLMCADLTKIGELLAVFEREGVEYLHIDIMDGHFVPNITLGGEFIRSIRKYTSIPFDHHLMVCSPEEKIKWFDVREGDLVSVHYESTPHVHRALRNIKEAGGRAGVALNPHTPVESIRYLLEDLDHVLLMTVDPGFAGQTLVPQTLKKIGAMRAFLDEQGFPEIMVEVDGNVSVGNARSMRSEGADLFVAGTSSVFREGTTPEKGIGELRRALEEIG